MSPTLRFLRVMCIVAPVVAASSGDEQECTNSDNADPEAKRGSSYLQVKKAESNPSCDCDKVDWEAMRVAALQTEGDGSCEPYCHARGCPCVQPKAKRCELKSCSTCQFCGDTPCTDDVVSSLAWKTAKKRQLNFAGLGPDAGLKEMYYEDVGTYDGRSIGVVLTNTTEYSPPDSGVNWGVSREQMKIKLKGGSTVQVKLDFVDEQKNPITLPEVHITLLDVDKSKEGKMEEIYRFPKTDVVVTDPTEVDVQEVGDTIQVKSAQPGTGCDNPKEMYTLGEVVCAGKTIDQKKRTAMLVYKGVESLEFEMEATCQGSNTCSSGRIFYFGWGSNLEEEC